MKAKKEVEEKKKAEEKARIEEHNAKEQEAMKQENEKQEKEMKAYKQEREERRHKLLKKRDKKSRKELAIIEAEIMNEVNEQNEKKLKEQEANTTTERSQKRTSATPSASIGAPPATPTSSNENSQSVSNAAIGFLNESQSNSSAPEGSFLVTPNMFKQLLETLQKTGSAAEKIIPQLEFDVNNNSKENEDLEEENDVIISDTNLQDATEKNTDVSDSDNMDRDI